MKTLELKDICGYLPYGLRIMRSPTNVPVVAELLDIRKDFSILGAAILTHIEPFSARCSDLTKGIIHRGEKFVPILALDKLNCFPISDTDKALRYYDKLNEWMFDYRGLISAGLGNRREYLT